MKLETDELTLEFAFYRTSVLQCVQTNVRATGHMAWDYHIPKST
jgi:hypothetical protein